MRFFRCASGWQILWQGWRRGCDWLSPQQNAETTDDFASQEHWRHGRLLAVLIAVSLPFNLISVAKIVAYTTPANASGLLVWFLLVAGSVALNRSGRVEAACRLFLISSLTRTGLSLLLMPSSLLLLGCLLYTTCAITVFASGFLIGRRAPFLFAALNIAVIEAHVFLHRHDLTTLAGLRGTPLPIIATLPVTLLLMIAALTYLSARSMEDALMRAQGVEELEQRHDRVVTQAEELTALNEQLLAMQAELEAHYRALETANDQLAAQATTDVMTGLANHRAFQEELARQIARVQRSNAPLALLLLDVDKFKQYNDSFGHLAGDEVLKGVGGLLLAAVREGDFPARYGGEEFAVVLPEANLETALQVAERIRASVEACTFPNRVVTVSIGVTQYSLAEATDTLIQRADVALYEAKAAGRNCVRLFAPMLTSEAGTTDSGDKEAAGDDNASVMGLISCGGDDLFATSTNTTMNAFTSEGGDAGGYESERGALADGETHETTVREGTPAAMAAESHADLDDAAGAIETRAETAQEAMQAALDAALDAAGGDLSLAPPDAQPFPSPFLFTYGGLEGLLQEPGARILSELLTVLDRCSAAQWGHAERVARYALRLGNELAVYYEERRATRPLLPRLTPGDITSLAFGALLHDIGKIGIPEGVFSKSGTLTEGEWRQIRRHPLSGAKLIADLPLLARGIPVVRCHHERWDGMGYPQGLAGTAIPLPARIFAVCDALDVMTTPKPYRPAASFAAARDKIARGAGSHFDPDVVAAFLQVSEADWQTLGGLPALQSAGDALRRAA